MTGVLIAEPNDNAEKKVMEVGMRGLSGITALGLFLSQAS